MTAVSSVAQGRLLEQRVASYFQHHGYRVLTNQILVGRSERRHEVDVLARKSDALTEFAVAIECKAWNTPIEKDVVTKLHYVMDDLGLHKGIIVSLAGSRAGADTAAQRHGIEIWGSEELRRRLGEDIFAASASSQVHTGGRMILGWPFASDAAAAQKVIGDLGRGRFGMRTLETLVWFAPLWVPAYVLHLTVAQPHVRRMRQRIASVALANTYDALAGQCLGRAHHAPVELAAGSITVLNPVLRESTVTGGIRKAVETRRKVTSAAAIQRHDAQLTAAGLPTPLHDVSIDHVTLTHLPVYAGLLRSDQDRIVAVSARTGAVDQQLSAVLTSKISYLRSASRT